MSVIDTATNTVTDHIPVGIASYAVAANPDSPYVYVTGGYVADDPVTFHPTMSVIDTDPDHATTFNKVIGAVEIPVDVLDIQYGGIAVSTDGSLAYLTHHNGGTMSVIDITDAAHPTVIGNPIPVGLGPFLVAAQGNHIYVTKRKSAQHPHPHLHLPDRALNRAPGPWRRTE